MKVVEQCIEQCQGCVRVMPDKQCLGYKDPKYQWEKFDVCPGYTDDVKNLEKVLKKLKQRSVSKNTEKDIKKTIEFHQQEKEKEAV